MSADAGFARVDALVPLAQKFQAAPEGERAAVLAETEKAVADVGGESPLLCGAGQWIWEEARLAGLLLLERVLAVLAEAGLPACGGTCVCPACGTMLPLHPASTQLMTGTARTLVHEVPISPCSHEPSTCILPACPAADDQDNAALYFSSFPSLCLLTPACLPCSRRQGQRGAVCAVHEEGG